jgi:hypothetical protein
LWAVVPPRRTGTSTTLLGLVLLCLGAGSLLAMPLSGVLAAPRLPAGDGGQQPADLPDRARPGLAGSAWTAGLVLFVFGAAVGRWTAR